MYNAPPSAGLTPSAPDLLLCPVLGFDAAGLPLLDGAAAGLALAPQPVTTEQLIAVCRKMPGGTVVVLGYALASASPVTPVAPQPDTPLVIAHGRSRIELHADGRVRICGDDVLVDSTGRTALAGAWIDLN